MIERIAYLIYRPFDYVLAAILRLTFKDDLKSPPRKDVP